MGDVFTWGNVPAARSTQVTLPGPVGKMSQPSTPPRIVMDSKPTNESAADDDSYGGYPFLEWEDLEDTEKAVWGASTVGKRLPHDITPHIALDAIKRVERKCSEAWTIREAHLAVDGAIKQAIRDHKKYLAAEAQRRAVEAARNASGRPSDLMAEGYMLAKAMEHESSGGRAFYERIVTFDRPVAKHTCLSGDRIAVGGDMLTSVTVTDSEPRTIDVGYGRTKIVHHAKAISI